MIGEKLKSRLRPLWQLLQRGKSAGPMWSGIYSSFDQVPMIGSGFEGRRFAEQTQSHTRQLLESARRRETILMTCEDSLLPMLASLVVERTREVSVLDFGGGTGAAYVKVVNSLPSCSEIKFDVVETASACELGQELFADDPRISFYQALPDRRAPIDIVHISSALQYVSDYRKTLVDLCGFRAPYFLLLNLSAAAIPTYATAQHVYDDMIVPYWFINQDEVIDILASESYRLLWRSQSPREYDQSNFPAEYRMGHTCNLLFRQDGKRI